MATTVACSRYRRLFPMTRLGAMIGLMVAGTLWPAATRAQPAAPCAVARITLIKMPVGLARYEAGVMRLSNGASLELAGSMNSPDGFQVKQMRPNDRVAACYGRIRNYADAGPSRTITILDLRTAGYFGTLIGNWPH